MRTPIPVPILMLLVVLAASPPAVAAPLANRLAGHPSPYLALHGSDPVAWQEWNAATVARARRDGKLLLVSVGYFTCHWCHVMQRESYKNATIARTLNSHFIPVKVDRELDPALDARLIEFADKTRGRSGWPLNVFVTPDGHPLYATLYHPPAEFSMILARIEQLWRTDRARLAELARVASDPPTGPGRPEINAGQAAGYAKRAVAETLARADIVHGGFGEQSKFPQVPQLAFLLAMHERAPEARLAEFLTLTLDAMAGRGLHDQLGGGFFRYAVDPSWKTPHFEKMLYDNAQLAKLYLDAARVLKRDDYRRLAHRTLDFLLREFQSADGGLIAALSALDGRGVEGGYYLWSAAELEALLTGRERAAYRLHAGLGDAPPFESGWLPLREQAVPEIADRLGAEPAEVERLIGAAEDKLRTARARRQLPRDPKVIAAWNGLALSAFTAAAGADPRYRAAARGLRDLLATRLWDGQKLARSRLAGRNGGKVALEDYAYVAAGLTDWALLTGDPRDLAVARAVAASAWSRHYGRNGWRLEEETLLVAESGQDIVSDGHMPSPSAVLIAASLHLAARTGDAELRRQALRAANSGHALIAGDPFWYATAVSVQLDAAAAAR